MKLSEIETAWTEDNILNRSELDLASLNIPVLHNKYLKIWNVETYQYSTLLFERKRLSAKLRLYYSGMMTQDELQIFGRPQFQTKIKAVQLLEVYVEADEKLIDLDKRIALQKIKTDYLQEIIKSITNRGFAIKNAIDFIKYSTGA